MDTRSKSTKTNKSYKHDNIETCNDINLDSLCEESRALYMLITERFDAALLEMERRMTEKDARIDTLDRRVAELEASVNTLSERLEDAECSERKDTLILSGPAIPSFTEGENSGSVSMSLLKLKLKINLKSEDILEAFRIGKRPIDQKPDKRSILIKLRRHEMKVDLLRSARKTKPEGLYLNESLSANRAAALFALRQAKRSYPEKISACGSVDGRIFVCIGTPGPSGRKPRIYINSKVKLEKLLSDEVGVTLDELTRGQVIRT